MAGVVVGEEDVFGFDVAMHDAALVGGGEGVEDLDGDGDRDRGWQRLLLLEVAA